MEGDEGNREKHPDDKNGGKCSTLEDTDQHDSDNADAVENLNDVAEHNQTVQNMDNDLTSQSSDGEKELGTQSTNPQPTRRSTNDGVAARSNYADRVARKMRNMEEPARVRQYQVESQNIRDAEEEELDNHEAPGDAIAVAGTLQQGGGESEAQSPRRAEKEQFYLRPDENEGTGRERTIDDSYESVILHLTQSTDSAEDHAGSQSCAPTTPPPRRSNDEEDRDTPGAFPVPGRAIGSYPAWARSISRRFRRPSQYEHDTGSTIETSPVSAVKVDDYDLESSIRRRIIDEAVEATVVSPSASTVRRQRRLGFSLSLVVIGIVVGIAVPIATKSKAGDVPSSAARRTPALENVAREGVLRCGVLRNLTGFSALNKDTGEKEGLDIDLCRAVAAAALGASYRIEAVFLTSAERFVALENGSVDLLASATTHTMEREVYQAGTKASFSFTVPYLYDGLGFGGIPPFVMCADNLDTVGDCADLKVCVENGTTHFDILRSRLPLSNIVKHDDSNLVEGLIDGSCNIIAGEQTGIAESVVRDAGYSGDYETGKKRFSKEPLAMVTRGNDAQWTDFANGVLQALLAAEEQNITQSTANTFTNTTVFGDQFENMFSNAIATVGNYGEMYSRHLESIMPREGLNLINENGETGLIYSHPFGEVATVGPGPIDGGVLEQIVQRGHLRCGITSRAGFGELDPVTEEWSGLDADFCRALSAGVFAGTFNTVVFVELQGNEERYMALANEIVDVLAGGSINLERDVLEPNAGEGFSFSQPYFYGDATIEETRALVTRQVDPQWSSFAYWIVTATFYAEENHISQRSSNFVPMVNLFGRDYERMFRDAIQAVGNYGEMYDRNVKPLIPRGGRNLLNDDVDPQHYPFPFN